MRRQALTSLALVVCGSLACGQTLLLKDDFASGLGGWNTYGYPGDLDVVNGQFVVTGDFSGPTQLDNPRATHVPGVLDFPDSGALPDQQTLELRADLISASENDVLAGIGLNWEAPELGCAYLFFKDVDELALMKAYNSASTYAYFYYAQEAIKNQNVTLVLAFTRVGSNVNITTQVLDKENRGKVLFERTVTDTPQADPVLPNGAVKGVVTFGDPAGTPWPLQKAPAFVELTTSWVNARQAPAGPAQVIYDNLEVRQYESPQLTVQNAVVVSWPVTSSQFILETAPTTYGPWTVVPEPWLRTKEGRCEAGVLTAESQKFYRLRQAP